MASTYSTNLKLELIGTGEQSGTWGDTTNTNLGTALEQAIVGKADITFSSTTETLSLSNSNAAQDARAIYLNLGGTPGGAASLVVPAIEKPYIVFNDTGETVTVKVSGQTGVAVPDGATMWLYNNGTDVVNAITNLPAGTTINGSTIGAGTVTSVSGTGTVNGLTLSGTVTSSGNITLGGALTNVSLTSQVTNTLPVTNGGTGATTITGLVKGNGTSAFSAASAGTDYVAPSGALGTPSSGNLSNCTVDGTNEVGFRNIPAVGTKTSSYTLQTADVGKYVQIGSGGSITIPDATFSEGDAVSLFNNTSGDITVTCSITTAYIGGADADVSSVTLATRGVATVFFISGTVCVITGNVS